MKALESRVAELETLLASAGMTDSGKDHWDTVWHGEAMNDIVPPQLPPETPASRSLPNSGSKRQQNPQDDPTSTAQYLKDLSLEAGGGYVGEESSNITVGHMLRSIVQGRHSVLPPNEPQTVHLSPKSSSQHDPSDPPEPKINELCRISDEVAETLVNAYFKHISTRWVALYRPQVRYLHKRRRELEDPFEISTLRYGYT